MKALKWMYVFFFGFLLSKTPILNLTKSFVSAGGKPNVWYKGKAVIQSAAFLYPLLALIASSPWPILKLDVTLPTT
jgi:hypothetical protein